MASHSTNIGLFMDVSPLYMENMFHPLSNADGEVDVSKIDGSSLRLIAHNVLARVEPTSLSRFKVIIRRIGKGTDCFEMTIPHDMGLIVPRGMIGYVCRARAVEARAIAHSGPTLHDEFRG